MYMRPIERPFGPTKGKSVITHFCVGKQHPNRKISRRLVCHTPNNLLYLVLIISL